MKKFVGGMSKDTGRVDQPEGTYRDALNINLNYVKGAVVKETKSTKDVVREEIEKVQQEIKEEDGEGDNNGVVLEIVN